LKILVLGSAAGGGFPQWNCNCANCHLARSDPSLAKPRTQSSIAVSSDGERWLLLNASPDIRQQLNERHQLHPKSGRRHSPISAVLLTNADVDHIAGLLTLRERQPFTLFATRRVQDVLAGNTVFEVLNSEFVSRSAFALEKPFEPRDQYGESLGITVCAFSVPGKVALFLEDDSAGDNFGTVEEDTVGLALTDNASGRRFYYMPGCAGLPQDLRERIRGEELLFMDGTTWVNEEMSQAGVGEKTSQRMGHMAIADPGGTLEACRDLDIARKVFIHINNTNPVLLENSPERSQANAAGWTVAYDGMEVEL